MEIYLLNLVWVGSCSILASNITKKYENPKLNEFGYTKSETMLSFLAFFSLALISALRFRVGTDYWQYETMFQAGVEYTMEDIVNRGPEYLSALLNLALGVIFNNPKVNFAVYSFGICFLFTKCIRDYADNYWMTMVLYIVTMNYYGSFNGIIQWMAAGILFFGYRYLVKKKFIKYLMTVLLATMFHSTALLGIPLYFIVNRKFKSKANIIIVFIFIFIIVFFNSFINELVTLLEGTSYGNYGDVWFTNETGREAHPLRFLVSFIPVFVSYIYYDKLKEYRSDFDILLNFSLLNTLFTLLALKNYIFIRFGIYCDIYNIFIIPLFIKIFNKNEIPFVGYIILGCYLVYMCKLLPIDSNLLPYQTIFSMK